MCIVSNTLCIKNNNDDDAQLPGIRLMSFVCNYATQQISYGGLCVR